MIYKRNEEELFKNKWLSLKTVQYGDTSPITYMHENRCDGHIVSILPLRIMQYTEGVSDEFSVTKTEFLIREETIYAWHDADKDVEDLLVRGTVTGGVEKCGPDLTAVHEMLEETGYDIEVGDLINLGTSRSSKSVDTLYHIYAVDLTGKEQIKHPEGDGGEHEKISRSVWVDKDELLDTMQDPLYYVALARL